MEARVEGCLIDVFIEYLRYRNQFVRADKSRSKVQLTTGGISSAPLPEPLLVCFSVNDLRDIVFTNDPYLFADDSKKLEIGNSPSDIQLNIDGVDSCVTVEYMKLPIDKCSTPRKRRTEKGFHFA